MLGSLPPLLIKTSSPQKETLNRTTAATRFYYTRIKALRRGDWFHVRDAVTLLCSSGKQAVFAMVGG